MSIEAMNWALAQQTGSPSAKCVLLILANRADHNGICWPGFAGICKQTELSRRAVIDNIKRLEVAGFLTIKKRRQPLTNLYHLNIRGSAGDALVQELHGAGDAPTSAGDALEVVQELHPGSAGAAPEPSLTTIKPKRNPKSVSPDWLNKDAWGEFEQHRKDIKKPLTDLARTKIWNKLNDLSMSEQQVVIDEAIERKWASVFPKSEHKDNSRYREL